MGNERPSFIHTREELHGSQVITQVDAFVDRRFGGDPAAVCVLVAPASAESTGEPHSV